MSASNKLIFGAAALALAGCAFEPRPPEFFPVLAETRPLIVVAEMDAGEYLRPLPAPRAKPGIAMFSMDPPPHWVRAEVHQTIYGPAHLPPVFYAGTGSHYGPQPMSPDPQLVFFITDGSQYIMQRYGHKALLTKLDGSLLLPVWDAQVSPWLPCAVLELREEIDSGQLRETLKKRDADYLPAMQRPDLFRAVPGGFVPRYAIDLRKLSAFLRSHPPPADRIECK